MTARRTVHPAVGPTADSAADPSSSKVSRRTFLAVPGGLATAAVLGSGSAASASPALPSTVPAGAGAAAPTTGSAPRGGLGWPADQVLPSFPRVRRLDVADATKLSGQDRALLATLQGVVNRRQPRIYLFLRAEDRDNPLWLDALKVPKQTHRDPMALLAKYRDEISGAIVYDPEVPDTINVATTLAGLEGAVIATPEQAAEHDLPVVEDLRGRFTDDRIATYRWQLEHLFPRCTQRILTGVPPTMTVPVPDVEWTEIARESERIRDSSNRKVYDLDVSVALGGEAVYVRFTDAFTDDGWGPSVKHVTVLADDQPILEFDAGTPEEEAVLFDGDGSSIGGDDNRFADGGNFFIYRFEPPAGTTKLVVRADMWNQYIVSATDTAPTRVETFPFFRDYIVGTRAMVVWLPPNGPDGELLTEIFGQVEPTTPYLGWFSNDVTGEWNGVGLAATQGVMVVAADFYINGSVLSGAPAPIRSRPRRRKRPALENKIYLTFNFGEGDNIQYCQHKMRDLWDNPDRGRAPMNWTISPLLKDVGPALLSHYQRTATENDLLVAGPSGVAYTYAGMWDEATFPRFTALTGRYMKATGLNVIHAFNNVGGSWTPLTEAAGNAYEADTPALGIFLSWEQGGHLSRYNGLPVIGDFAPRGSAEELKAALDEHVKDRDPDEPLFVAFGVHAWSLTPTHIADLVDLLPAEYEVVLADVFFDLLRRSAS